MNGGVKEFIRKALAEDVGNGDITSESIIGISAKCSARIVAKQRTVLAGVDFAREVFAQVDPNISFRPRAKDAALIEKGETVVILNGLTRSILAGERLALNMMQRLSGIASLTRQFVDSTKDFKVRIVDTRKTTPGMRFMEKYAVRAGGGYNHRFGLFDGILIKDNHIIAAGGIKEAVKRVSRAHHLLKVEVEVTNLKDLREAIRAGVDIVMLDNMRIEVMREAVRIARAAREKILLEASGNVSLSTVRDIAATGVDLISIGAITHSAPAADLSLKVTPGKPLSAMNA